MKTFTFITAVVFSITSCALTAHQSEEYCQKTFEGCSVHLTTRPLYCTSSESRQGLLAILESCVFVLSRDCHAPLAESLQNRITEYIQERCGSTVTMENMTNPAYTTETEPTSYPYVEITTRPRSTSYPHIETTTRSSYSTHPHPTQGVVLFGNPPRACADQVAPDNILTPLHGCRAFDQTVGSVPSHPRRKHSCPAGTKFDLRKCVCNHVNLVDSSCFSH